MSEMDRLIDVLEGRWNCRVTYEPNPQIPTGGNALGWEECRVGPGRHSILFDTRADGSMGEFAGAGQITWNAADGVYGLQWLTSDSPDPGVFTGRWVAGDVVFDGHEYLAGQRFQSRHSITGIAADAFVYTVDRGVAPGHLERAATIEYTRD
jgi:hypothetical protein